MGRSRLMFFFIKIIILLFISCAKKSHEFGIYLTKQRINSKEGVSLYKLKNNSKYKKLVDNLNSEVEIDTIKNKIIYGGEFDATINDIEKTPFINSYEINSLDTLTGNISFDNSVISKLHMLKPSMYGRQFAICLDNKIIFTGYFWTSYSSYVGTWNYILYNHTSKENKKNYYLEKSNGMNEPKSKINFSKYPDLINYLKSNNKLK